jgi:hypothetical protein
VRGRFHDLLADQDEPVPSRAREEVPRERARELELIEEWLEMVNGRRRKAG